MRLVIFVVRELNMDVREMLFDLDSPGRDCFRANSRAAGTRRTLC